MLTPAYLYKLHFIMFLQGFFASGNKPMNIDQAGLIMGTGRLTIGNILVLTCCRCGAHELVEVPKNMIFSSFHGLISQKHCKS